jgi:type II secretory pathway pseudopilin PulG
MLIVLIIMGITMSMVAPKMIGAYEKIQAGSEVKLAGEILRNVGVAAFLSQTPRSVKVQQSEIVLLPSERKYSFKRLIFPTNAEIKYNRRGFPDKDRVTAQVAGRSVEICFGSQLRPE